MSRELVATTCRLVALRCRSRISDAFRLVDHVIVMTEGGPNNSSSLLLYYIYEVTFRQRDFAYGATLTVLMVFILGLLAITQFWLLNRKAHYQ